MHMPLCAGVMHYHKDALTENVSGKASVQSVVNKKGNMEDMRTINKVHPSLENEAIRILRAVGKNADGFPVIKTVKPRE